MLNDYIDFTLNSKSRECYLSQKDWTIHEASCYLCDLECYYDNDPPYEDKRYIAVKEAFVEDYKKKDRTVSLGPNIWETHIHVKTFMNWANKCWEKHFKDDPNFPFPTIVKIYNHQVERLKNKSPDDELLEQVLFLEERDVPVKLIVELLYESYKLAWGDENPIVKKNVDGMQKFKSEILPLFSEGKKYARIRRTDIAEIVFRFINPNNRGGSIKGKPRPPSKASGGK